MKAALPATKAVFKEKNILNCINVRNCERVDNEGDEGAATFDGKSLRCE